MEQAVFPIWRGLPPGFFRKRLPDFADGVRIARSEADTRMRQKKSLRSAPRLLTAAIGEYGPEPNRQRRRLLDEVGAGRRLPLPENDEDA